MTSEPIDRSRGPVATEKDVDADRPAWILTYLANERTFLGWYRTAAAFIALGLAAARFLPGALSPGVPLDRAIAILLVASGTLIGIIGSARYLRTFHQLQKREYEPTKFFIEVLVGFIALIGVVSILFIVLLQN